MSFFEAAVETLVYETSGHLILDLKLNPLARPAGMERGNGGWTVEWKRGRAEDVRQERKEEARQIGRRTRRGRTEGGRVRPFNQAQHWSSSLTSNETSLVENMKDIYMATKCTNVYGVL